MVLWARSATIAVIVLVWIAARALQRRPLLAPWVTGMALMGVTTTLSDLAALPQPGPLHAAVWTACGVVFFLSIAAFAEGMRRELGARPAGPRLAAGLAAVALLLGVACSLLPDNRGEIAGGIIGAAVLLNYVLPLLEPARRRTGAWLIAAGLVIYALGRTAWVIALLDGANPGLIHLVADMIAIAVTGAGLIAYDLAGLRAPQRAVGGGPTAA